MALARPHRPSASSPALSRGLPSGIRANLSLPGRRAAIVSVAPPHGIAAVRGLIAGKVPMASPAMPVIDDKPMLEVVRCTHFYGATPALDDVSLGARRGEFLTILGESGSGKTTMLRIILGLERPTRIERLAIDPRRSLEARDDAQHRRLAGSALAEDGEELAAPRAERDVVERRRRAIEVRAAHHLEHRLVVDHGHRWARHGHLAGNQAAHGGNAMGRSDAHDRRPPPGQREVSAKSRCGKPRDSAGEDADGRCGRASAIGREPLPAGRSTEDISYHTD